MIFSNLIPNLYFARLLGDEEAKLKQTLRKFPLWAKGHLKLARILFDKKKYIESYVSIMATNQAVASDTLKGDSDILLAKIYTATGSPENAISLLKPYINDNTKIDIIEEYVSALLLIEDFKTAYEILVNKQDKFNLNPVLQSAFDFVKFKNEIK